MRVHKSKCAGRVHVDGFQNDKLENPPLKEGAIIHHLGKWCIAPCRGLLRCRSGRRKANVHWTLCALRTADDFRRFPICSNHHRGSYPSPALAYASYPFVELIA